MSDAAFDVQEHLPGTGSANGPENDKVVYLSLGSLGCMDVGLMQRLFVTTISAAVAAFTSIWLKPAPKFARIRQRG